MSTTNNYDVSVIHVQPDKTGMNLLDEKFTLTKWQKYITTLILFYVMLGYGMICSILGPSLVDFQFILSTSFSEISKVTTVKELGLFLGALISGFAYQFMNRQLLLVILMSIASSVVAFLPFSPSLIIFLVLGFISSFGYGALDTAINTWFIEMWQENSNSILQVALFINGIGKIVAPFIEKPYLIGEHHHLNSTDGHSHSGYERQMLLSVPFVLMSAIQLSSIILLAIMYCYKKYQAPVKLDEDNQDDKKLFEDSSKLVQIIMISMISLCLGFYISIEYCHFAYLVSYGQYIPLKITAANGAMLQSLFSASYTAFRAVGAFVALKLSPGQMMSINYSVIVGSNIALLFSSNSKPLFTTANCILGAGMSTMWGSIFSFADQYLVFDNFAGSMLITISAGTAMASLYIVGKLINSFPLILIYCNLLNAIISILIFLMIIIIIVVMDKKSKRRPSKTRTSQRRRSSVASVGATISFVSRRSSVKRLQKISE